MMAEFQKEYPMVQYEIYTANADDIKERLDRGLADFGLLMEPVDISKYNFIRLKQKENWGIIVRDDSPLADRDRVTAEDLLQVPLISVKRTLVKKELEGWLGDLYDQVQIAAIYNLINNGIEMVESGIGALLCFQIRSMEPGLRFISLYPAVETGSVLVWRKNQVLSQAAYRFLEEFTEDTVENWADIQTVYIGYPIWWGIAAWTVNQFVKNNDFTGKTVIPFCTSASSGLGDSGELLAEMAETGDWLDGQRFSSNVSEDDVKTWLDSLELPDENAGEEQE